MDAYNNKSHFVVAFQYTYGKIHTCKYDMHTYRHRQHANAAYITYVT